MALAIGGLGWIGTPKDKAVLGTRAVVTHKAQRLTSDIVVRALAALGIAEINKTVAKGGNGITFPSPITRDGPGWLAEVDLPYGVTVTDVLDRRAKLASGLRRPLGAACGRNRMPTSTPAGCACGSGTRTCARPSNPRGH
jgi:S-DNA-T family DNA segregation ATPase FtsK/SpoIIIE